jgi:hypothetical protein
MRDAVFLSSTIAYGNKRKLVQTYFGFAESPAQLTLAANISSASIAALPANDALTTR